MDTAEDEHIPSVPGGSILGAAEMEADKDEYATLALEGGIKNAAAEQLGGVVGGTSAEQINAAADDGQLEGVVGGASRAEPTAQEATKRKAGGLIPASAEAIVQQGEDPEAKRTKFTLGGDATTPDASTDPGPFSGNDGKAGEAVAADGAGAHDGGSRAHGDHASANVQPHEPIAGPAGAVPYHMLSGWRPHECSVCSKVFPTATRLRTHERSHTGLKPFPCDKCDKSFRTATERSRHEPVHTGEKPFACDKCDKKFSDPSSLMRHERVHGLGVNGLPGQI